MIRHSISLAAAVVLAGLVLSAPSGRGNASFTEASTSTATIEVSEPTILQRGSLLRATLACGTRVVKRYAQRPAGTHFALRMSFVLLDMNRVIERY